VFAACYRSTRKILGNLAGKSPKTFLKNTQNRLGISNLVQNNFVHPQFGTKKFSALLNLVWQFGVWSFPL